MSAIPPTGLPATAARQVAEGEYALLWESEQLVPSRFNSQERLEQWLASSLEGKGISSRKEEEGSYLLTADGEPFARLTIQAQGKKNFFGGQPHQITQVETTLPMTETFTITAPEEAQVTVNGVSLTQEDRAGEAAPLAAYDGCRTGTSRRGCSPIGSAPWQGRLRSVPSWRRAGPAP